MTPVAITVAQPFASLLAHGIAEWHTSRARPRLEPGQEVWVHAGKQAPTSEDLGDWCVWQAIDNSWSMSNRLGMDSVPEWTPQIPLPLGAVLSRHRLAEVVPVGIQVNTDGDRANGPFVYPSNGDAADLYIWKWGGQWYDRLHDISDQLPYSDWSPGRWAWRLELIERLETPVAEYPMACDDCADWGCPNPHARAHLQDGSRRVLVPVRGRPGIWRPDPALIAAVRGEG